MTTSIPADARAPIPVAPIAPETTSPNALTGYPCKSLHIPNPIPTAAPAKGIFLKPALAPTFGRIFGRRHQIACQSRICG